MVQVAVPSRERVEQLPACCATGSSGEVGRINGEYGRVGEPAIHYLNQPFDRAELAALYRAADVMVVTPLRDGMNLVAKEYVAARDRRRRARWCSASSPGRPPSCPTRTWSTRTTSTGSSDTLMQRGGRRRRPTCAGRMAAMRGHLRAHDIQAWARGYLTRCWTSPSRLTPGCHAAGRQGVRQLLVQPVEDRVDRLAPAGVEHQVVAHAGEEQRRAAVPPGGPGPARTRGTTRSSGLPTTSTGGSPTGGSGRAVRPAAATAPAATARPSRPAYARAAASGSSRLNSWRAAQPQPRRRTAPAACRPGCARSAAPSVAQPAKHRRDQHRRPGPGSGPARAPRPARRRRARPAPPGAAAPAATWTTSWAYARSVARRAAPLSPWPRRLIACAGKPAAGGVLQPVLGEHPGAVAEARARTAPAAGPRRPRAWRVSTSRRDRRHRARPVREPHDPRVTRSLPPAPGRRAARSQRPQVVDVADLEPVPGGVLHLGRRSTRRSASADACARTAAARAGVGLAQPQPAGRPPRSASAPAGTARSRAAAARPRPASGAAGRTRAGAGRGRPCVVGVEQLRREELEPRQVAGGEHDQVGLDRAAVGQLHARCRSNRATSGTGVIRAVARRSRRAGC